MSLDHEQILSIMKMSSGEEISVNSYVWFRISLGGNNCCLKVCQEII